VAEEPKKDVSWSLRGKIGAGQGQHQMVCVAKNASHTRFLSSCGSHKSSSHEEESQRTAAEVPSRLHGVVKRLKMARNARNHSGLLTLEIERGAVRRFGKQQYSLQGRVFRSSSTVCFNEGQNQS
jgi:hypothetical protein